MMCKISSFIAAIGLVGLSQAQECWNRAPIDKTTLVTNKDLLLGKSSQWCQSNALSANPFWSNITTSDGKYFYVGKVGTFGNEHQCEVAWNKTVNGCYDGTRGGGSYTDSYYATSGAVNGYSLEILFGAWPIPVSDSPSTTTSTPTPTPTPTPGWSNW